MSGMSGAQQDAVVAAYQAFGPARVRFCPLEPTPRQEAFLLLTQLEALFGGAAGGGKSVALLMAALQYADVPGYDALLLRPTIVEFMQPGGLIELSHRWLDGTAAVWSGVERCWRFPGPGPSCSGGASLSFGYLADSNDVSRYFGTSYSFVGFDELVRFSEPAYRRMFRALRQAEQEAVRPPAASDGMVLNDVPVRMRATSNPGGPGHNWVKMRFVDKATRPDDVIYLASSLEDNPYLDRDSYLQSLSRLPGADRERLLSGNWEVADEGALFQRPWFELISAGQMPPTRYAVRYWDLAGSEPCPAAPDPDYTVGLRLEIDQHGTFYIRDLVRVRKGPGTVEEIVAATAATDGRQVPIVIEQEPGAAGVALIERYRRHVLRGYSVHSDRPSGTKEVRAQPVAAAAEHGLVKVVRGPHIPDFMDEICAFPNAGHDDCVDAFAGAHAYLARPRSGFRVSVTKGRIPTAQDRALTRWPAIGLEPGGNLF